jgi:hypothetical protein
VTAASRFSALRLVSFQKRFVNHNRCKPRGRRDRVTLTHTDASGSMRTVVPLGTALSPGDTVLVGERWFWAQSEFIGAAGSSCGAVVYQRNRPAASERSSNHGEAMLTDPGESRALRLPSMKSKERN